MSPTQWTDKQERQYEHIRDSYLDDGLNEEEAEERAARTVNARRAASGEAEDSSNAPSRDELYAKAQKLDIKGRSHMDKRELENAIAGHKGGSS